MQIDRYQHLQFPLDSAPSASGDTAANGTPSTGAGKSRVAPLPPASGSLTVRADSVVLRVQFPDAASADPLGSGTPVYSDARKANASADDRDEAALAAEHQRALDRNAGTFTQLTLNKDGVLVAKPQPAREAAAPDFVALAVSAMREFSDEAERQKARSVTPAEVPAEMAWGKLKSLQQLAARFNVFA
ncbi:MAG: hypothetical protein KAX88_01290 [Rhodoferax sp.]|nr:hypothetical protein [Rhodoferax sp.]